MKNTYIFLIFCLCVNASFAQEETQIEKPIIGISCSHPANDYSSVRRTYTESVLRAGGLPVLIPIIEDEDALNNILSLVDGLILTGGEDIHPHYYNEEPIEQLGDVNDVRDVYDLTLIRMAASRNMPLWGICRGEQLINVAFGGTLYQDIPAQYSDSSINHRQEEPSTVITHYIDLLPGSLIAKITGETELLTNTHHHQAVKDIAPGFRITAWACDSIPEAIEAIDGRPIWGVQFHPEGQACRGDSIMSNFFRFFTEQASIYRFKQQSLTNKKVTDK